MSPALANFVFEAANFLLLAGALGWVLFKPVRRALDAERQQHDDEQRASDRQRALAESLAEEARSAKQAAERDVEQSRQEILSAAKLEAARVLDEAREAARVERRVLQHELEAARNAEVAELANTVGELAAQTVRRLLEALPGPSIDVALVGAACAEIENIPAEARRPAQVESARELDADATELLQAALGGAYAARVVAELGAGVRVTTPGGQVDATALSLGRHAGRAIQHLGTRNFEGSHG